MTLTHQTSNLTKHYRVGHTHALRYSFLWRVVWMVIALTALMAVTICTYQGTENLMYFLNQWGT